MAAILWERSLIPWTDPNGDPYAGAKAYFFEAGTTTPLPVYTTADLSITHDHPVIADSSGQFPAIFLTQNAPYRLRILDADDATIWDVDNISVPINVAPDDVEGDTAIEFLHQTGDIKSRFDIGTHDGWARCNGRTIGNASSGATERANADTEDLFAHLWQFTILTVSGGRGASSAADFAANKTITLPDFRSRVLAGRSAMGSTDSGLVASSHVDDSNDADDLGATSGADDVTLTTTEMPNHNHGGATASDGAHTHGRASTFSGSGGSGPAAGSLSFGYSINDPSGLHTHTISAQGGGAAHLNMQPTVFITYYIKL